MDTQSLQQAVQQIGAAALAVSFVAGVLFSFNPVALAAIPVSMAYVAKARSSQQALWFGAVFIAGMVLAQMVLGAAAGLAGLGVQAVLGRHWGLVLGPWLIVLGLLWTGWVRVPFEGLPLRARRTTTVWGIFVLGALFAIAICPVCTPALIVLLGVAGGTGSALWGAALLLSFALGRALPMMLGAGALRWIEQRPALERYRRAFDVAGGIALVAMGLYMINAYFIVVPTLAA
jgi:cytochrome c-type biogenesis protein